MKTFTRVAFLSFLCAIFPLSSTYAQDEMSDDIPSEEMMSEGDASFGEVNMEDTDDESEMADLEEVEKVLTLEEAKALIDSAPTAPDAVSGTVEPASLEFYDMYSRQLAYRENVKELRASLEARRDSFAAPRVAVLEEHRVNQRRVYAAETAASMESDEEEVSEMEVDLMDDDDFSGDAMSEESEEETAAMDTQEYEGQLIERAIPSDESVVKKKVITSDDAPNFDPENL